MTRIKYRKKSGITKITTSFTVDTLIFHDFDAYCKVSHINKSAVVSDMIDGWMKLRTSPVDRVAQPELEVKS